MNKYLSASIIVLILLFLDRLLYNSLLKTITEPYLPFSPDPSKPHNLQVIMNYSGNYSGMLSEMEKAKLPTELPTKENFAPEEKKEDMQLQTNHRKLQTEATIPENNMLKGLISTSLF